MDKYKLSKNGFSLLLTNHEGLLLSAHWLDKAMQANVDAKQVANLPTLDDDNAWSQLQDWIKLPDDDPNVIG